MTAVFGSKKAARGTARLQWGTANEEIFYLFSCNAG